MRSVHGFFAVGWCLAACLTAAGFDPGKIDRTIGEEPRYGNGSPRYCLLVFGPEASHRVWLVQDRDTLYVDRDADGDLTGPGERFAPDERLSEPETGSFYFIINELSEGDLTHKRLTVWVRRMADAGRGEQRAEGILKEDPDAGWFDITLQVQMPGRRGDQFDGRVYQSAGPADAAGYLQFSRTPTEAPVVHLRGPWQVTFYDEPPALAINRTTEVILGVATPGHGPGTTAWTGYDGLIPEGVKPSLEVTFLNKREPVRELYELPHRC